MASMAWMHRENSSFSFHCSSCSSSFASSLWFISVPPFRSVLAFLKVAAAPPGVDHTGEDLPTVPAPERVDHDLVCPAIPGPDLLQGTGGFLRQQFQFALFHQFPDIGDAGQV